jgi:hypothetical protein
MSWAAVIKTALDWRAWAVAATAGLALTLWVVTVERDRASDRANGLADDVADLRRDLTTANAAKAGALKDKVAAEKGLADYARVSATTFQAQAEESARMSAQLAELNRRVRAANQEIARADGSLRLDDPLPRGVRDSLACAGGDERACAPAAAAPAGRMPGGAADAGAPAGSAARGRIGA